MTWLLATLALAAVAGLAWRARQGAWRAARAPGAWDRTLLADLGVTLGERATLVQFSSAFCQPCRVTRGVLQRVARDVPGVTHVEVDAEAHLDAVRRLGVHRTPTTLLLDRTAREVSRSVGAPRIDAVLAAVDGCTR